MSVAVPHLAPPTASKCASAAAPRARAKVFRLARQLFLVVPFFVVSRNALGMHLLLFDDEEDACPTRIIPIDPRTNRTYYYRHVFVPGLKPG
jgi:hypothetical protein